jgi:hypothetical protein
MMTYKNKLIILSGVIAALAVVYLLTVIFDPRRTGAKTDAYSWLEGGQNDKITGIVIAKADETVTLARNGGKWFVTRNGKDHPARQSRVDDFIAALAKRDPYPVRSSSVSSHERLSLTPEKATQVIVSAGAGLPLLSLLIGQADVTGRNVYLRKQGQNEVRSGEDRFSQYTDSALSSWYNLRLLSDNNDVMLNPSDVQRLIVYPMEEENEEGRPFVSPLIFTRSGGEWTFNFELANPDFTKVDSYIRDILGASGDDFSDEVSPSDPMFNAGRIVIDLGSGVIKTVRVGPPDEEGGCYATVSGSDLVYSIPSWTARRLFVGTENFEAN